jgi:hypothetical protein
MNQMEDFKVIKLDSQYDTIFTELYYSIELEDIMKGRKGANLVDFKDGYYSLVRTTTQYTHHSQLFPSVYNDLISEIIKEIKLKTNIKNIKFNNALVELYDTNYKTMKFHTDQTLDIADNSYICIYSCYPKYNKNLRSLIIRNKKTGLVNEIILKNNSCILFSTDVNAQYQHKIIYSSNVSNDDKWLGITFRLSKTFISFNNEVPYFKSGQLIKLANDIDKIDFIKHKTQENKNIGYKYPNIDYTLSIGDLLYVPYKL